MQRFECLGDRMVLDVSHAVEEKDVGAQLGSGGPGFDAGEVDVADCELGQCRHQRAGNILQPQHHRRPVGAGASRRGCRRAGQHEAGARVGFVDDVGRQHGEAVTFGRQRRAHGGVGATVGDVMRGRRVGVGGHQLRLGQVGRQPVPHLGGRDREGGHRAHVRGGCPGPDHDREGHVEGQLGEDLQPRPGGQAVQGRQYGSLDRVLDRHAGVVGVVGPDRRQCGRGALGGDGHEVRCAVVGDHALRRHPEQCRLGEGSFRSEVGDAGHVSTLSGRWPHPW